MGIQKGERGGDTVASGFQEGCCSEEERCPRSDFTEVLQSAPKEIPENRYSTLVMPKPRYLIQHSAPAPAIQADLSIKETVFCRWSWAPLATQHRAVPAAPVSEKSAQQVNLWPKPY